MSQSVTWSGKYGKLPLAYEDIFAFFDYMRDSLILCLCRSVNHQMREPGAQFRHTAGMIVVMVGQEDGFRLPAILFYCLQNRGGLSGVDNDASTRRGDIYKDWNARLNAGDLSVIEWYRMMNTPEHSRLTMEGDFGAAAGARSPSGTGRQYLAYWETRNLRMVANLRHVIGPGRRVLALVGASHKPYYERYLGMTSDVELVPVDAVLDDPAE